MPAEEARGAGACGSVLLISLEPDEAEAAGCGHGGAGAKQGRPGRR